MKKIVLLICIYFLQMPLMPAQKVKETYDDVFLGSYDDANFAPIDYYEYNSDIDSYSYLNMGSYWSGVLESLLRMYETTGDKAYLYKFIYPTMK